MTTGTQHARRLASIDALRGGAALAVVLCHSSFAFGYVGVYLFFVISGFCIHMRWAAAAAAGHAVQLDFWEFWKRRTIRLYPPYLMALVISLGALALDGSLPAPRFLAFDIGLHLVMLHNFTEATRRSLNPVFWTLAVEEQLYLAYFALLAMRIRWGWTRTLGICLAARILWIPLTSLLNGALAGRIPGALMIPLEEGAAWHWFVWALGALGVEAAAGLVVLPRWCHDLRLCVLALAFATTLTWWADQRGAGVLARLPIHPLWGVGFFLLLNVAVRAEMRGQAGGGVPAPAAWMARVGVMSYSLYLTHTLVVGRLAAAGWLEAASSCPGLAPLLTCSASLVFAWGFFRLVERPFIGLAQRVRTPLRPAGATVRS